MSDAANPNQSHDPRKDGADGLDLSKPVGGERSGVHGRDSGIESADPLGTGHSRAPWMDEPDGAGRPNVSPGPDFPRQEPGGSTAPSGGTASGPAKPGTPGDSEPDTEELQLDDGLDTGTHAAVAAQGTAQTSGGRTGRTGKGFQYGRRGQPKRKSEPPAKRRGFFGYLRDFTYELVKIIAIVLILRAYVLQASTVDGQSMEPTLHHGDYLLVERLTISLQNLPDVIRRVVPDALIPEIERGDIVVLSSPENGNNELVKRVAAVGGDAFFFCDGRIWVNGEPLGEDFLSQEQIGRLGRTSDGHPRHYHDSDIFGMPGNYKVSLGELEAARTLEDRKKLGVKIPEGCLFVMGDNRESSKDSRAWSRTQVHNDSPGTSRDGTDHLWATVRSVHGRVLMRLRLPWDYDDKYPVFPK